MGEETTSRIIELLEEILKWVRLEGAQRAKDTLTGLLKTDTEKLVYENSDGRTSREIAGLVGTSHVTVINYWKKWLKFGIVKEMISRGGTRFVKVFSLADFGIEVPRLPNRPRVVDDQSRNLDSETAGQSTRTAETGNEGVQD
jgi:hypothetical protein